MTDSPAEVLVVLTTVPDAATGERIAQTLVGERLAACVNRLPGAISHYRWEGALQADAEELLLVKTVRGMLDRLQARLKELHPYACPECLVLPAVGGSEAYLEWVRRETGP